MLELLYATGLRVTELCGLEFPRWSGELGVLRVTGQRQQARMVPFGESGAERRWTGICGTGVRKLLKGRASPYRVCDGAGRGHDAPGILDFAQGLRPEGGNLPPA